MCALIIIIIISGFLINMQVRGLHPHQWPPFQVAGLLYVWQTPHQISRYFYHCTLCSPPVSCFHVIFGLPGPCFPATCRSKAVLTAPLEHSTCPYQGSKLSFRMRSRSSMLSRAGSSLDLVVTMSFGLTLRICLISALSFPCRHWRFGFVNGQVSLAWSIGIRTQELYMRPRLEREVAERENW